MIGNVVVDRETRVLAEPSTTCDEEEGAFGDDASSPSVDVFRGTNWSGWIFRHFLCVIYCKVQFSNGKQFEFPNGFECVSCVWFVVFQSFGLHV